MKPEKIKIQDIRKENNQEIRRIMIERYKHGNELSGYAAYMKDVGAYIIHRDETGILYRINDPLIQDMRIIEVDNGTIEPDGTRKKYFLSVPPFTTTAIEGVAYTYGMSINEYKKLKVRT